MKTNLLTLTALLGLMATSVTWAQTNSVASHYPANSGIDVTAFLYPSSITPKTSPDEESPEAAVQVVTDFLDNLANSQIEKAQLLMSADFEAIGPDFRDGRDASAVLSQAEREQKLFGFRTVSIQQSKTRTTSDGSIWVYMVGEWTAIDKRDQDKPVRMPFHLLSQVVDGKLVTTYTSYGNDQIFYDFGFPIYQQAGATASTSNR